MGNVMPNLFREPMELSCEVSVVTLSVKIYSYFEPIVHHTECKDHDVQYDECKDEAIAVSMRLIARLENIQSSVTFVHHPDVKLLLARQFSRPFIRHLSRHEHAR
jgi:hypothetical protein